MQTKRSVDDPMRSPDWKERVSRRISSARSAVEPMMDSVRDRVTELRHNPAVIGGLAAAGGFALGLASRRFMHRARIPQIVLIEAF